jgi:hypothetical protein
MAKPSKKEIRSIYTAHASVGKADAARNHGDCHIRRRQ